MPRRTIILPPGHARPPVVKLFSLIFLLLCAALFLGVTITGQQSLPEKVASHFDSKGVPNGWIDRSSFTSSMVAVGFGLPAFVAALIFSIRFFPVKFLNAPNSEYWRKPRNHRVICDFLFYSSLVFGGTFLIWQTILFALVISANQTSPPHLNTTLTLLSTIPLLAFIVGWVVVLLFRFQQTDDQNGSAATRSQSHSDA